MRITNNMMLRNASNNINANKVNVNNLENQMSSQKKIQRPSEDPIVAIRALRLRSTLSEINQYLENNISDAEAWLEITETALYNMNSILDSIREQCVYGANDSLTADDRNTILTQLEELREQIYSEGNADYAGRTVFTGYRTNQTLTFMEDEQDTRYNITQSFSYSDIEEHRYYSGEVTVPTTADEVLNSTISDPQETVYNRIRLAYGELDSITDADGNVCTSGDTASINYTNSDGTTGTLNVTVYATMADWEAASGDDGYSIADGEAVVILETGEMILSDDAASTLRSGKATLDINYTKTGFDSGELRPEYYYNCTDLTDEANPVEYVKFDEDGNEIYQDINYVVASSQTLTVNTSASSVFDSSIGRDVDELIEAVRYAIEANEKVEQIQEMMSMQEYADDESQAKLEEWLAAAQKEADYADDNMQKLYDTYIGNFDDYMEKVNLAYTEVGSKGSSLELTKNRMTAQQTTIEELKSSNEDRDLSEIIIDYTAAYYAYEASLQAASKINQTTLLNYL